MSEQSAKSFLKLLEQSQIVQEDRLKEALASLSGKADGRKVDISELADHLMNEGVITDWHVDKLRSGKYKGYFLGNYKLLRRIGSGGMSSVYLAEHAITNQKRAIKVLPRKRVSDKSYLDRFYQEARAAASVNHPNVVRIYDICHERKTHYMVMEYLEGSDLSQIVKTNGPLEIEQAVKYLILATEGLAHIHQQGLVHRDIKPANLLLTSEKDVKILDLGLALIEQDDEESLTLMYNEKVMGTADYLSPEQAVNSHDVDHRADIYSLGCTLYFLLTGKPPFPKGNLAQRIAMHQTQEPADIRESRQDCPDALAAICQQMMMKQPENRYPDCQTLKSELNGYLETGQQLGIGIQNTPISLRQQKSISVLDDSDEVDPASFKIDTDKQSGTSGTLKRSSSSKKLISSSSKKLSGYLPVKQRKKTIGYLAFTIGIVTMFVILALTFWILSTLTT